MSIELPAKGATVEVVVQGRVDGVPVPEGWLYLRCNEGRNLSLPISALVSVTEIVPEPTVNGAVVRDDEGRLWVRIADPAPDSIPWRRVDQDAGEPNTWDNWASIPKPVTVRYDPAQDES